MPATADEFRTALSRFASGVTVVTGRDTAGVPFGITVSAFCSVSLEPPQVLICIQKKSHCNKAISESGVFVVNILSEDQELVSNVFASHSDDKFASTETFDGIDGAPGIVGAIASIECRKVSEADGGDHTIFIGEVERASVSDDGPLVYWRGSYRRLADR